MSYNWNQNQEKEKELLEKVDIFRAIVIVLGTRMLTQDSISKNLKESADIDLTWSTLDKILKDMTDEGFLKKENRKITTTNNYHQHKLVYFLTDPDTIIGMEVDPVCPKAAS